MRLTVSITVITALTVLCAGCQIIDEPVQYPQYAGAVQPAGQTVPVDNRFVDNTESSSDSVESVLAWSEKYEKLLATTENLTEKNNTLSTENNDLKQKVSDLTAELDKTKAELKEAGSFIQQMHVELGKWKTDVLGFREEMRSAQAAELVALKKILRLLGAEMTVPAETIEQTEDKNN